MPRAKATPAVGPKKSLKRFKPEQKLNVDSLIVINGRPNSGKTTALVDFVAASSKFLDGMLLVTESAKCIQYFKKHIPLTHYIHVVGSIDTDHPLPNQMVWDDAAKYIEKTWIPSIRKRYDKYVSRGKDPLYYGLVLDDLGFDKKRLDTHWMHNIYSNHRQMGIVPYIVCQDMMQFPSTARGQISHAVTFRCIQDDQVKKLQKNYFNHLPPAEFKKVLFKATEPPVDNPKRKGCLVMDMQEANEMSADDPLYPLYWYRADVNTTNKQWFIGNPVYFSAAEQVHTAQRDEPPPIMVMAQELQAAEVGTTYDDTALFEDVKKKPDVYDPDAIYLEDEDDDTNSVCL
jgi:hypothetical protein